MATNKVIAELTNGLSWSKDKDAPLKLTADIPNKVPDRIPIKVPKLKANFIFFQLKLTKLQ